MLQLENHTPFAPALAVFPNRHGVDSLYIVVKATFDVLGALRLAENQVPPVLTDEYYADPGTSSLRYASELHIGKAGTDVILMGHAYAPGRPVPESAVRVSVAERKKVVRVLGDRVWLPGGHSSPEPFESIPLTFERAFGGQHEWSPDEPALAEERNPVGVGFRGRRSSDEMAGQPLPNLEDPRHAWSAVGDRAPPACFAFTAPGWMPRRAFAGTYDDAWQTKRAPYLPHDFDHRFFNGAAAELTFERFIEGGEPVEVLGASRQGPLRFAVPRLELAVTVSVAGRREQPPLRLDTLLIEPDQHRVCASYRAELSCDRQVLKVEKVVLDGTGWDMTTAGCP
ncbi:MAG TPA: DUF2169 domain-containing protein [Polyangiaceae bacterium]|nr:DUF2169 domain-containing protein [Polyangiaceae bacterium]